MLDDEDTSPKSNVEQKESAGEEVKRCPKKNDGKRMLPVFDGGFDR